MSWLLRLLLLILLIRAIWRLVAGIVAGMGQAKGRAAEPVQLVRDPVCGTYVVPSRALPLTAEGTTHYFCSDRCRERYHDLRRQASR
jgi:YHS domain-containing protein